MGYGLSINSPQNRCWAQTQNNLHKGLVAYWKLNGDCRDYSGYRNHGINHGVKLTVQAGEFNGTGYIEVPHSDSLSLGTKDFSVAAWIRCNELTDDIGDILSKYDPVRRKGFNFSVVDAQYRSPANRRNLFFGIDDGKIGPWTDCGKCDNVGVWCLCVHRGKLYAGSYTRNNGSYTDLNPQGHVYRWAGETTWTDLGRLGDSSNVLCLASFRGELYAGVSCDRGKNGLAGRVYRYDQDNERWVDCGQVGDCQKVECMAVFRGSLYVGISGGGPDSVYRYEGGIKWTSCEKRLGGTTSLGVCLGNLYAGRAHVDRYEAETTWTDLGRPGGEANYQIWSVTAYQGRLFVGSFPSGHVYRHEGGIEWTDYGRLQTTYQDNGQKEVMSLLVYNGKLYGSVRPPVRHRR